MNRNLITMVVIAGLWAPASRADLVLQYKFDEGTGTTAVGTGSDKTPLTLVSETGVSSPLWAQGVSEKSPFAFNNTARIMGGTGCLAWSSNVKSLLGLKSFTLTGWCKKQANYGGTLTANLITAGKDWSHGLFALGFTGTGGHSTDQRLVLSINNRWDAVTSSNSDLLSKTNQWIFFAATYDSLSPGSTIYVGDATAAHPITALTSTNTTKPDLGALKWWASSTNFMVGGFFVENGKGGASGFQGQIDDVRVYGSYTDSTGALSASAIESIRKELLPTPAPAAGAIVSAYAQRDKGTAANATGTAAVTPPVHHVDNANITDHTVLPGSPPPGMAADSGSSGSQLFAGHYAVGSVMLANSGTLVAPNTEEVFTVFSSKDGFAPLWSASAMNGLEARWGKGFGRGDRNQSVEIKAGPDGGRPNSEFGISGKVAGALYLNRDIRTHGDVEFYLITDNKDRKGGAGARQTLQFCLDFLDMDGVSVRSPTMEYAAPPPLNDAPGTWQLVTIRIARLLKLMKDADAEQVTYLGGIKFRFVNEPCPLYLTDCSVKLKK